MKKNTKKIIQSISTVLFVVLFSGAIWIYNDITQYYKAPRTELMELLKSSDDIDVLESITTKRESSVLHFSNNDWMAILWIDNHGRGHPSTTVIRCSDGSWFYSHDHALSCTGLWWEYLGKQFVLNERIQQSSPEEETESIKIDLRGYWPFVVDEKPSLNEAKTCLAELEFKPLKI